MEEQSMGQSQPTLSPRVAELWQETIGRAQMNMKQRIDVVTLAKNCRNGLFQIYITPAYNGFSVVVGNLSLVYTNPAKVGQLIKTLFSSNLDNEEVLARLRRLVDF